MEQSGEWNRVGRTCYVLVAYVLWQSWGLLPLALVTLTQAKKTAILIEKSMVLGVSWQEAYALTPD